MRLRAYYLITSIYFKEVQEYTMSIASYNDLSITQLINLAIDFVKTEQPLPEEIRIRLHDLNLLTILDPQGVLNEDTD